MIIKTLKQGKVLQSHFEKMDNLCWYAMEEITILFIFVNWDNSNIFWTKNKKDYRPGTTKEW